MKSIKTILAAAVMATGKYQFNCSFKDLFASTSQVGNETIMFRSYSAAASVRHCIATYCMPQYGQGGYATFANLAVLTGKISEYENMTYEDLLLITSLLNAEKAKTCKLSK